VLYDPARHEPLQAPPWDPAKARDAIAAICQDAEAAFDRERLWPLHPTDDEPGTPPDGILRGLFVGAAGMIHALSRLAEQGHYDPRLDLAGIADGLLEGWSRSPDEPDAGASLFVGSTGILLVAHRLAPSAARADAIAEAIASNSRHPANELLLGAPGTMLAARAMHARTGEERFKLLWRAAARTLLDRQEPDGLWTQDIYAMRKRHLGAAHGFAGNALALTAAPRGWLDDAPAVEARAAATARAFAHTAATQANWAPYDAGPPSRVQWCHGAPGFITSLAGIALQDGRHGALLTSAAELVWRAGPLRDNPGLCHGTAGNGFAFLALHARTQDERHLARARAFAMHALRQATAGRGRYTLFTGDVAAALLAAACLDGRAAFPGLQDL
jgi:hypothetical protein